MRRGKKPVSKNGKVGKVSKVSKKGGKTLTEASDRYKDKGYKGQTSLGGAVQVAIITAMVVTLSFGTWMLFGDQIMNWFGFSSEVIMDSTDQQRSDIEREIELLTKKEDDSVVEEVDPVIQNVDVNSLENEIGEGVYLVGVDIKEGVYLMTKGSAFNYYNNEVALASKQRSGGTYNSNYKEGDPEETEYKGLLGNQFITLSKGQYIEIVDGGMVYNDSRPSNEVKINESVILLKAHDYKVGQDIPAGYYRVLSTELQKGVNLGISNKAKVGDESLQRDKEGEGDRQTYTVLIDGNILRPTGDVILTRVSKSFVY